MVCSSFNPHHSAKQSLGYLVTTIWNKKKNQFITVILVDMQQIEMNIKIRLFSYNFLTAVKISKQFTFFFNINHSDHFIQPIIQVHIAVAGAQTSF